MKLNSLVLFCFLFSPVLGLAEVINLNCIMLYDKVQHIYSIDTKKNLVMIDGGPPLEAIITASVISFSNNYSTSGAIWSHSIQRQNGAMTIMDLKDTKVVLNLQCERVVGNKF